MKKLLLLTTSLLLVACSQPTENNTDDLEEKTEESARSNSETAHDIMESESQKESESTTESSQISKEMENSEDDFDDNQDETPRDMSYAVPIENINQHQFVKQEGTNSPHRIDIDGVNNQVTLIFSDGQKYTFDVEFEYEDHPQEIRVLGAYDNNERSVYVVTEIDIEDEGEEGREFTEENLYLFYNADNGVSLATPNYAGNYDKFVYQEYVEEK